VDKTSKAVLLLAAALAAPAWGQEFPSRPVRFLVPLAPGGGADITVRAVAQKLGANWKQTVVVDNRPGGTGTIALEMAARAAPDVLAGHISMVFATPLESVPHIKAGRLRPLGVTSARRSHAMPELPTIAEGGAAGYEVTNWYGVLAPARIARPLLERINRSIVEALRAPDLAERFRADGVELIGSAPAEFHRHIQSEIRKWEKVVAAVGIN
jgi:tripartite-type tricarboxylate transporter receptor subunit TctC